MYSLTYTPRCIIWFHLSLLEPFGREGVDRVRSTVHPALRRLVIVYLGSPHYSAHWDRVIVLPFSVSISQLERL